MDDLLTPEWLKDLDAKESAEELRSELHRQRKITASLRIAAKAPEFFKDFLREISITAECLKQRGLAASVCNMGCPASQQGVSISVGLAGLIAKHTWTNVFYTEGHAAIQGLTLEGTAIQFSFCVHDDNEVGVLSSESPLPMDSKTAAQFIMERMVKIVKQ